MVVPFGCAVLVLRDSDDRAKFANRAVMMLFAHYSEDHPLFTYAVYSPRTKRLLHRQDVIFLTSVFPMRAARVASGLGPDGIISRFSVHLLLSWRRALLTFHLGIGRFMTPFLCMTTMFLVFPFALRVNLWWIILRL